MKENTKHAVRTGLGVAAILNILGRNVKVTDDQLVIIKNKDGSRLTVKANLFFNYEPVEKEDAENTVSRNIKYTVRGVGVVCATYGAASVFNSMLGMTGLDIGTLSKGRVSLPTGFTGFFGGFFATKIGVAISELASPEPAAELQAMKVKIQELPDQGSGLKENCSMKR